MKTFLAGLLIALSLLAAARAADFGAWLRALRKEALSQGISQPTLDRALGGLAPIPSVLELDRNQPEQTLSFTQYIRRIVPADRVALGRGQLARHRPLLEKIQAVYPVQPRFVVALWALESDFGRNPGGFPVVGALATLAHDQRRSRYFRRELLDALRILEAGDIPVEKMVGSWAGAMGQCQFMPSVFLRHAVDYNGDGRRDIWDTPEDVFASMARFLARLGWRDDQTWGREVRLPPGFDERLIELGVEEKLPVWQALGIRRADGRDLPTRKLEATLVRPDRKSGRVFVVYNNFQAIMKWNRSTYFALAVGHLADRLAARE